MGAGLIGAEDVFRAAEGGAVVIARAALGAEQIVKPVLFVQVRSFQAAAQGRAHGDPPGIAHNGFRRRVILHKADPAGLAPVVPGLPFQGKEPLAPVVVMKEGGVEARRVEIHRLRPGTVDLRGGDQIVVDVKKAGVHGAHDPIDQIKQPVLLAPAQAGRPHALGGGKAPQRKPLGVPQQMGLQLPVLQVPGMVYRDPGEPLKGGAGQIVVVSPAAEAGVGVKARQDGISDHNDIPRFMDNMIVHVIPFPEICPP